MTDDELMERIARHDAGAARILVERWERPVFAFLKRMVGSREDAQDLSQEVFLRVCESARRYDRQGRFKSWLFRIAGNLARTSLRRRKILRWIPFQPEIHDPAEAGGGPDRRIEREEEKSRVEIALGRLPARQRQAVLLRRFEEMSYRDIASTMKISSAAVESLLQRAMKALRADLAGEGGAK